MQQKQVIARLVQALYGLGRLDEVLDGVREPAADFEFPSKDFLATMKLIPGMQYAAYAAVVMNFAGDVSKIDVPADDRPLFDVSLESDNPFEEMGPAREYTPKTREQIQHDAAAVHRVCESASRVDTGSGRNWLQSMSQPIDHFDEEKKVWKRDYKITRIVLPFNEWLDQQIAEKPVNVELNRVQPNAPENAWPLALRYAKQAGAHVPYWDSYKVGVHADSKEESGQSLGASDAMEYVRDTWLKETVWAREFQREMMRLERLVTKTSNNAWRKLQAELLKKEPDDLVVIRFLDNTLLANSPEMTEAIGYMKNDPFFKKEVAVARLEKAVAAQTAFQLKLYPAQVLNGTSKLTQADIDALPLEVQAAIIEAKVLVETKKVLAQLEGMKPVAEAPVETPEAELPKGNGSGINVYAAGQVPIHRRDQQ